jgi:tRNA G18 (ribose-2'-O)-methylase SpoU
MGSLLRTAQALGFAVVLSAHCCDAFNEKAIRAGTGAQFLLPLLCSLRQAPEQGQAEEEEEEALAAFQRGDAAAAAAAAAAGSQGRALGLSCITDPRAPLELAELAALLQEQQQSSPQSARGRRQLRLVLGSEGSGISQHTLAAAQSLSRAELQAELQGRGRGSSSSAGSSSCKSLAVRLRVGPVGSSASGMESLNVAAAGAICMHALHTLP